MQNGLCPLLGFTHQQGACTSWLGPWHCPEPVLRLPTLISMPSTDMKCIQNNWENSTLMIWGENAFFPGLWLQKLGKARPLVLTDRLSQTLG